MGKFIWHEWAQFVNIFASVCACPYSRSSINSSCVADALRLPCPLQSPDVVWAGFWGCLFPKFFWDFVRGSNFTKDMATAVGRVCTDATPCGIVYVSSSVYLI